ncbi:imidazolonepropionase [Bacteroides sp.]|uniref:imidazolonepropionase n=1 Tax=Bacteroides sp. TaxID=29523 RepID=UPI00258A8F36|nr:imidazolonepropionase [Bacteroides sp.]
MKENLIIRHAHIVTPKGTSALKGEQMSQLESISNGVIEITDGIITYVGTEADYKQAESKKDFQVLDVKGKCVLPGFVDSHTHFVFGGERSEEFSWRLKGESYMSIMNKGGGIMNTVRATRTCSFEDLKNKSKIFLDRMTEMGVTTVEGKSGYGLDKDTELLQLQVMQELNEDPDVFVDIITTFLGAHALPVEYAGKTQEYIEFMNKEVLPVVKEKNLAEFVDVFCEKGVFSIEESRQILSAAKALGFKLKLHADEIVSLGGAELAAELGAFSADHLLHASDQGIKDMADKNVVATLLPLTAFALKEEFARGREMIDSGCAVALATDLNPGSCFSGSIPLTIALSCIYMKLSIEETITALTLNGAAAIDRADKIGSIEKGKAGDLIVLMSDDYYVLPYYIGMNTVQTTIKGGKIIPQN